MPPGYYPPYQEFHQGQQYWSAPWQPQWTQIMPPPPPLEVRTRPGPVASTSTTTTQSSSGGMRAPFKANYTPIITRSKAATPGNKNLKQSSTALDAKIAEFRPKPPESAVAKNCGVSDMFAKSAGIGRPPENQTPGINTKTVVSGTGTGPGTSAPSIPTTMAQNPIADLPVVNMKGQ